jgi:hypothetical protein
MSHLQSNKILINFKPNFSEKSPVVYTNKFSKFLSTASDERKAEYKFSNRNASEIKKTLQFNKEALIDNNATCTNKKDEEELKEIFAKKKKIIFMKDEKKKNNDDETYSCIDVNEMLDYIFDPGNNLKKEYEKVKKSNSCKCKKTSCSKYSCNCLRNGNKCDLLCSCKNCENKEEISMADLISKKIKRK